jgi:hypothetical protein
LKIDKSSRDEECKTIKYSIENVGINNDLKSMLSKDFLIALEKYFDDNPEFYLNIGGTYSIQYTKPYQDHVTKAEVEEKWIRNADGIHYLVSGILIYVNNYPLDIIFSKEFNRWDLTIGTKPVSKFLKEKEFYFRILKINGQDIPEDKASAYLNALKKYHWNQLNQHVKN